MYVTFAKGTVSVEAPAEAVSRYGASESSILVFADRDGFPLDAYIVGQQGPSACVEALAPALVTRVFRAFNGRPVMPAEPKRKYATTAYTGVPGTRSFKRLLSAWPHKDGRRLPTDQAEKIQPGISAEIAEYNLAAGRYAAYWKKWTGSMDAALLWDAFHSGLRPLSLSAADKVFGTRV